MIYWTDSTSSRSENRTPFQAQLQYLYFEGPCHNKQKYECVRLFFPQEESSTQWGDKSLVKSCKDDEFGYI